MSQSALGKGLKASKGGVLGEDLQRAAVNGWISGKGFPNAIQLAEISKRLHISSDALLFGGDGFTARAGGLPAHEPPRASDMETACAVIAGHLSGLSPSLRAVAADSLANLAKHPDAYAGIAASLVAMSQTGHRGKPSGGESFHLESADKTGTDDR